MSIPDGAFLKAVSAHYNELTLPRELKLSNVMERDIWGRVVVEAGEINLHLSTNGNPQCLTPENPGIIPPEAVFHLETTVLPVRFYVEYHHTPLLNNPTDLAASLCQ